MFKDQPTVFVIGLGQYFRKLRSGIEKFFRISGLADRRPVNELRLPVSDREIYTRLADDKTELPVKGSADCVMILTSPAFHLPLLERLAEYQLPVFVDKPLLTTWADVPRLEGALAINPHVFCSDFYPDIRALPLRAWMGEKLDNYWLSMLEVPEGSSSLWVNGETSLGAITSLEGHLLEGSGTARSFGERDWLWDTSEGGVLRDLMYHHITLSSFILDTDLRPSQALLKTLWEGADTEWSPDLGIAETHAAVSGITTTGIPFEFGVGKYYRKQVNDRYFTIRFARGAASMIFDDPNTLVIEVPPLTCKVALKGDYYEHVARGFRMFLDHPISEPHGLYHALRAVRAIDEFKDVAVRAWAQRRGRRLTSHHSGPANPRPNRIQ